MTLEQLAEFVGAGESETLEFKKSTAELDQAARTVCAMLNHRGGKVVLGVTPDGKIAGQNIGDRTVENIAQSIQSIDPPAFPAIDRVPVRDGREVIIITASPGQSGPYTYRQRAYRRVGNTNEVLTPAAYKNLLLESLHAVQRWENQSAPDWTVTDLDQREIHFTVEEAIRRGRLEDPGTRDTWILLQGLGGPEG